MIAGLHHIAIIVSAEQSIDFYKLLGFSETFRKKREYDTVVLLSGYGLQLEVFIDPQHLPHLTPEPIGLRHFALKVDNLEREMERLKQESNGNIKFSPLTKDWLGTNFCFVEDPDGLQIELHE